MANTCHHKNKDSYFTLIYLDNRFIQFQTTFAEYQNGSENNIDDLKDDLKDFLSNNLR